MDKMQIWTIELRISIFFLKRRHKGIFSSSRQHIWLHNYDESCDSWTYGVGMTFETQTVWLLIAMVASGMYSKGVGRTGTQGLWQMKSCRSK